MPRMPSKMIEKFIGETCQSCHFGAYREFPDGNEWNVICNDCGAIQFCYEPLPHQVEFHSDPSKYRLFAGKHLPAGVKSNKIGGTLTA